MPKGGVEALDGTTALLFLCADSSAEEGMKKAAQMLMNEQQASIPQAVFRKVSAQTVDGVLVVRLQQH